MYLPASFQETRAEVLCQAMERHPLATLVTVGTGGLVASHVPLLYSPAEGGLGVLRGHLARANPQWKDYRPEFAALAIFSGPEHYVSPTWYPSLQEHGKVVPTWNYVAVHACGTLTFPEDPAWLLRNVSALTDEHELPFQAPWRVADAPPNFIEDMLRAIVGVELTITELQGKWKVSQNRATADREGVVAGLEELDTPAALEMAKLVKDKLPQR